MNIDYDVLLCEFLIFEKMFMYQHNNVSIFCIQFYDYIHYFCSFF